MMRVQKSTKEGVTNSSCLAEESSMSRYYLSPSLKDEYVWDPEEECEKGISGKGKNLYKGTEGMFEEQRGCGGRKGSFVGR